jgi:hypothetical protein
VTMRERMLAVVAGRTNVPLLVEAVECWGNL